VTNTGLRWGILGPGGIAQAFASDLVLHNFTVQAVGSRRTDAAASFAEKFGIPNVHGSYEALVADPEVDAIYIATPHPFHAEQALLALNAGKHVLVESPSLSMRVKPRPLLPAPRSSVWWCSRRCGPDSCHIWLEFVRF
jgi:shikimate 5-dehydrogenase